MKNFLRAARKFLGRMLFIFFGALVGRLGWELGGLLWRLAVLAVLGGGAAAYFGHSLM